MKLSRDGMSDMDKGSDKLFTVYTEANWLHNAEQAGNTNVAQHMGDDGYSDTALTVGFKYKF